MDSTCFYMNEEFRFTEAEKRPSQFDLRFRAWYIRTGFYHKFSIIDTDYDNYAVLYSCIEENPNGTCMGNQTYVLVLGRKQNGVPSKLSSKVNQIINSTCVDPVEMEVIDNVENMCKFDKNDFPYGTFAIKDRKLLMNHLQFIMKMASSMPGGSGSGSGALGGLGALLGAGGLGSLLSGANGASGASGSQGSTDALGGLGGIVSLLGAAGGSPDIGAIASLLGGATMTDVNTNSINNANLDTWNTGTTVRNDAGTYVSNTGFMPSEPIFPTAIAQPTAVSNTITDWKTQTEPIRSWNSQAAKSQVTTTPPSFDSTKWTSFDQINNGGNIIGQDMMHNIHNNQLWNTNSGSSLASVLGSHTTTPSYLSSHIPYNYNMLYGK